MPNRLGRMPVKPEVPAADAQVGGDGKLLAGAGTEQRAIVADAEPERGGRTVGRAAADVPDKREFAAIEFACCVASACKHPLRIGQWSAPEPEARKRGSVPARLSYLRRHALRTERWKIATSVS
jgi:hypothetical protein